MAQFTPRPTRLARMLRNNATDAEKHLWRSISNRQLGGYKFSRQMPVAGFICDFICRERRLIVEVDGGQHDTQARRDQERTRSLEAEGFRVIRFWNNEVLENSEGVLQAILEALNNCPPPTPPASGRGVGATPPA